MADTGSPGAAPHIAVLMTRDATLVLGGKPATLQQVQSAVDAMKKAGGEFWYARDGGDSESTPAQDALIQQLFGYVVNARLPVRLFTDGTFTTPVPGP